MACSGEGSELAGGRGPHSLRGRRPQAGALRRGAAGGQGLVAAARLRQRRHHGLEDPPRQDGGRRLQHPDADQDVYQRAREHHAAHEVEQLRQLEAVQQSVHGGEYHEGSEHRHASGPAALADHPLPEAVVATGHLWVLVQEEGAEDGEHEGADGAQGLDEEVQRPEAPEPEDAPLDAHQRRPYLLGQGVDAAGDGRHDGDHGRVRRSGRRRGDGRPPRPGPC
mmetsp:Transcript_88725/g.248250  ORF Transcript_88725/g.248250 Transcript_88725/m.248250 type:complete len:223 (+) Transcript_88725:29-697(+)